MSAVAPTERLVLALTHFVAHSTRGDQVRDIVSGRAPMTNCGSSRVSERQGVRYVARVKKTTAERDPAAAAKLRDLIEDISVAMLTTVTPDGALRSRPMATREADEDGQLWFFTADDSGKTDDLAGEQAVNVSYADTERQRYVSVSGMASLVHDDHRIDELWDDVVARYFPRGRDDPHVALLCVRIETAEYWDASAGRMIALSPAQGRSDGAADGGSERAAGTDHAKIAIRAAPTSG